MQVKIGNVSFEVPLLPFRLEGNDEYILLDTSCLLDILPKTKPFFFLVKKRNLKIAILEKTIREVEEHLTKSLITRQEENASTFGIESAGNCLRKILMDTRIKKISNPTTTDKKLASYRNLLKIKYWLTHYLKGNSRQFRQRGTQLFQIA